MKESNYLLRYTRTEDPLDLDGYTKSGGFNGLRSAVAMDRKEAVEEIKRAKLAGRGGAGVDAGFKWSTVPEDEESYVVCNADEGEPGTFKDRFLMEKAPYLLIEGMLIAGYTTNSSRGYIYVRGEYPEVIRLLEQALQRVREKSLLGNNILDSGFNFEIDVKRGGGSYVVGDETALLSSLMGNRGHPWYKPPYPTQEGLWKKPTLVNNVETLSCVPVIFSEGSKTFASIGSPDNPGPKLYSVSGHVESPGVYEFPMGIELKELIEAAGGVRGTLKAVQIGGTAGPVYDHRALSYTLDFKSMKESGGSLGSGAIVVMNTSVNMAQVLQVTMRFFSEESCGQCFPCRYGTRQLEYMANRIASGGGRLEYLDYMKSIVDTMKDSSFCPFGQSIRAPLTSMLDQFGDEIRSFIKEQEYMKEVV
ncbi:MAG: complex I 51 kDa subunit family protein [Sediminispirochaetaceae bacterium]